MVNKNWIFLVQDSHSREWLCPESFTGIERDMIEGSWGSRTRRLDDVV